MKKLLLAFLAIAALMFVWRLSLSTSEDTYRDKIVLRWVTDINPTRAEQVAEFERLHPDIHVIVDPSSKNKELIQLSGGKGPDLLDVGPEKFLHYAINGVLYDLSELREKDTRKTIEHNRGVFAENLEQLTAATTDIPVGIATLPSFSHEDSRTIYEYNRAVLAWNRENQAQLTLMDYPLTPDLFWHAQRQLLFHEGKMLAVPANSSSTIIIYNKIVFDRYGVEYPKPGWSTEDFYETAHAVTHKKPGENVYESFGILPIWVPQCWVYLGGGRFFSEDGTEAILTESGGTKALEFLGRLFQDNEDGVHVAPSGSDSIAGASGRSSVWENFARGNIGMINAGRWVFSLTGPLLDYGYLPMPRFPDVPEEQVGIYFGGRSTAITRDCQHPEAAFKFLKYLSTRDYGRILVSSGDGVSGVRYYQDEEWALFQSSFPEVQARMLKRLRQRNEMDMETLQNLSSLELKELAAQEWQRLNDTERSRIRQQVTEEMKMIYRETAKGVGEEINPHISRAAMSLTLRNINERAQLGTLAPEHWGATLNAAFERQLKQTLEDEKGVLRYTVGKVVGFALFALIAMLGWKTFRQNRDKQKPSLPGSREEKMAAALFLAPNLTGFFIFTFLPVIFSFLIAFTNFNTLTNKISFVGFENFVDQLCRAEFWYFLFNTVVFMIGLPIAVALSLLLAILLNNHLRGYIVYRTVFYLPSIVSGVAIFMLWTWMYEPEYGLINATLRMLGLDNPPNWLNGAGEFLGINFYWAKPALIGMSVWMQMGGPNVLLFLAGLSAISPHLYEAADIDGANHGQKFWAITWPLLSPTTFFIMIMGVIQGLQGGFEMAFTMTQGGPQQSTTTLGYHIYNTAFFEFEMGQAAAVSWFLFLLLFGLTIMNWKFGEKRVNY